MRTNLKLRVRSGRSVDFSRRGASVSTSLSVNRALPTGDDGEPPPGVDMLEAVFEEVKRIRKVIKVDLPEIKPQI
jgi:hypothetical protein